MGRKKGTYKIGDGSGKKKLGMSKDGTHPQTRRDETKKQEEG